MACGSLFFNFANFWSSTHPIGYFIIFCQVDASGFWCLLLWYNGFVVGLWLFVNVWHEPCQHCPMCDCLPAKINRLSPFVGQAVSDAKSIMEASTLLSKLTEAVWDYICGYHPHCPPLHQGRVGQLWKAAAELDSKIFITHRHTTAAVGLH